MKRTISMLFVICLVSTFTGVVMVSVAGGALFPSLTKIAYPLLASKGEHVELILTDFSYKPGQSGTTVEHVLVRADGTRRDVSLKVFVVAGLAYGFLLFLSTLVVTFIILRIKQLPRAAFESLLLPISIYVFAAVTGLVIIAAIGSGFIFVIRALARAW